MNSLTVSHFDRVAAMAPKEVEEEYFCWPRWARQEQLQPDGDWTTWLLMGGRGSGKTRAGAEWVRQLARNGVSPIALVGETMTEAVEIMVRGESGLMAVHHDEERPVLRNKTHLSWLNGVEAQIMTASDPERFRGPQFAAAWCDEVGCGAVDKGANQPNIFGDPKSAEGGRPHFSNGSPDGLIQRQVLRAHHRFWADAGNNPTGMVDTSRLYCWTWDARPYPAFPAQGEIWSDGDNHRTGHWLTGRLGALAVDELAAAIAGEHEVAVEAVPNAPLIGGLTLDGPGTARDAIEPLLEMTGQKLLARDGMLVGVAQGGAAAFELDVETLAESDGPVLSRRRGDPAEKPSRLAFAHYDRERDFLAVTATAMRPGRGPLVTESGAVVLDAAGARRAAERLLDARAANGDRIEFALPPGDITLEPGDGVRIPELAEGPFQITEIRDGAVRKVTAVAVARGAAVATGYERVRGVAGVPAPPVTPVVALAHMPPLPEDPGRSRLVVGAYASPWPGEVRLTEAATGTTLAALSRPAVLGETVTALAEGPLGRWDRGAGVEIELLSGHLADAEEGAVLGGSNRIAIEGEGGWEVIGFTGAELVAAGRYRLTGLLRGLEGTVPQAVDTGRRVMVLDTAALTLPVEQHWIGEVRDLLVYAGDGDEEGDAQTLTLAPEPALPLAPVHLRARRQADGSVAIGWVRRSRADADGWGIAEPPIEHMPESWRITISDGGTVMRTLDASSTAVTYSAAQQLADFSGPATAFNYAVAQVSAVLGAGHEARRDFHD